MQQEMTVENQVEVTPGDTAPVAVRKERIEVDFRPFIKRSAANDEALIPVSGCFSSMSALGIQTFALSMLAEDIADYSSADEYDLLF